MNLGGEQFENQIKIDKNKRLRKIILVIIILLFIALIAMGIALVMINKTKLEIKFNGQNNNDLKNILKIEDGKVYAPIRDVASIFQYESYNGNYTNRSEDNNECYIETDEEAVVFSVGTDKIEKIDTNTKESTYYYADEPIQMIDGKLYTSIKGMEIAFNANVQYDTNLNKITINTMQYLMDRYKNAVIQKGYKEVSTEFNDQKAILEGLVIVQDDKKQFGVIDLSSGNDVLECKYSNIKYIPASGDFWVESNGKIGIKTNDGKDKIKVQYESIELISQELKLYVVQKDKKFGIINQNEKVIIPIRFNQIGIEPKDFEKNNIKNKYVLFDKIVPVMKNDIWGLYNIEGELLTTEYGYDKLGCKTSSTKNKESILIIPNYNVIVGYRDKGYYLINEDGEELLDSTAFEDVYMTSDDDETNYFLVRKEKEYDAIKVLEKLQQK